MDRLDAAELELPDLAQRTDLLQRDISGRPSCPRPRLTSVIWVTSSGLPDGVEPEDSCTIRSSLRPDPLTGTEVVRREDLALNNAWSATFLVQSAPVVGSTMIAVVPEVATAEYPAPVLPECAVARPRLWTPGMVAGAP